MAKSKSDVWNNMSHIENQYFEKYVSAKPNLFYIIFYNSKNIYNND